MHTVSATVLTAIAGFALFAMPVFGQGEPGAKVGQQIVEKLPIRKISLYRSGVGSFERRGLIDGDATVQLRFETEQVNDILKSMVVLDLSKGQGRIDGVSYGSKDPLTKRLGSFAVDISDDPNMSQLLGRLRGASVALKLIEGRETKGLILGVETRQEPVGEKSLAPITYVNLLSDAGVQSIRLSMVVSFDLQDPALRAELNKALAALAEFRADRTKAVDIQLSGTGAREIVVGYVQEAPVWKTSYRLILPDSPKQGAANADLAMKEGFTLQGWAIVENTTDEDWTDVRLSLVSGRPVSFRMDLYEPLYVYRPEVPVPTVPGVSPRAYEGGAAGGSGGPPAAALQWAEGADLKMRRDAAGYNLAAPGAPAMAKPASRFESESSEKFGAQADALSSEDLAAYSARAQAAAMEVGEVFQYELEAPVTVERKRSAMLPILSAAIEGRRVSIFNPADGSQHPMRGVQIVNSSNLQLMPGPISVFDSGSYAGDSQVGHVSAGDKRLVAYAVDLDVSATTQETYDDEIRKVRIVKGVLELTSLRRSTRTYDFNNKDLSRSRTLVVEHPKRGGWELKQPAAAAEVTPNTLRFEVPIDAGKSAPLAIVEEMQVINSHGLVGFSQDVIMQYSRKGAASDAVVNAFGEIAKKQGAINAEQRKLEVLDEERNRITEDQNRIRQNMNTIDRNSDLYRRYLTKFTEQETRVENIAGERDTALQSRDNAQRDLESYVSELTID